MPIFELQCTECGHKHEKIMSHSDLHTTPASHCPKCHLGLMIRIPSSGSFTFAKGKVFV